MRAGISREAQPAQSADAERIRARSESHPHPAAEIIALCIRRIAGDKVRARRRSTSSHGELETHWSIGNCTGPGHGPLRTVGGVGTGIYGRVGGGGNRSDLVPTVAA